MPTNPSDRNSSTCSRPRSLKLEIISPQIPIFSTGVNDLLMAIRLNPNSHIDCLTLVRISTQRNVSGVEIHAEELVTQLTLVIVFDLAGNLLRDVGDSAS